MFVQQLLKSLEYQTHVLPAMLSMRYIDSPAGFWHLLNECMLSLPCWVFPWVSYKKCMCVLGRHTLSVHSPGPPPAPCRQKQVPE